MVGQVDEDRAQGQLQEALGHLVIADHMGQAMLSCRNDGLIWAGQVLEEELDDALTQVRQLKALTHLQGSLTVTHNRLLVRYIHRLGPCFS